MTGKNKGVTENPQPLVLFGSPGRTRTSDQRINSPSLYQLSYRGKIGVPDLACTSRQFSAKPRDPVNHALEGTSHPGDGFPQRIQ
jgi:hypothetical protein